MTDTTFSRASEVLNKGRYHIIDDYERRRTP
jgi:hypothetical protein